jgi:hypothetical protein
MDINNRGSSTATELQEYPLTRPQQVDVVAIRQEEFEVTSQSLPACDGGKDAWRLLISAFVFEALLWGM